MEVRRNRILEHVLQKTKKSSTPDGVHVAHGSGLEVCAAFWKLWWRVWKCVRYSENNFLENNLKQKNVWNWNSRILKNFKNSNFFEKKFLSRFNHFRQIFEKHFFIGILLNSENNWKNTLILWNWKKFFRQFHTFFNDYCFCALIMNEKKIMKKFAKLKIWKKKISKFFFNFLNDFEPFFQFDNFKNSLKKLKYECLTHPNSDKPTLTKRSSLLMSLPRFPIFQGPPRCFRWGEAGKLFAWSTDNW